jgi:hypothetical protein
MTNPNLIELAAEIADYMVIQEHKRNYEIFDENGDIVYTDAAQKTFNDRYDFILNKLEEGLKK